MASLCLFLSLTRHSPAVTAAGIRLSGYVPPATVLRVSAFRRSVPLSQLQETRTALQNPEAGIDLVKITALTNSRDSYQLFLSSETNGQLGNMAYRAWLGGESVPLRKQGVRLLSFSDSHRDPSQILRIHAAKNRETRRVASDSSANPYKDTLTLSIVAQ
jgi:hypothetical protein